MAYQAPYSGLAQLMEMQGRGPDTRLVHMTPMELRTLQAMSPTGRLTTNPDTGLPEAGILEDILPIALPLAGSVLFPMAAPTLLGSTVLPAAVGAGLGSTAAGLVQGRGLGESLIQGGLSGLMSYGLGSAMGAFAPSGGVTAGPPTQATMAASGPGLMATAPDTAGAVATAATPEPTGLFGRLGEMAKTPVLPETMAGAFPESYAAAQAAQAVPTYGSAAGAGLSGALAAPVGQGLGLMAPDEMPFDLAYDEYDPYFDADLEGGRRRGRARVRSLQRPPAFSSPAELRRMATTGGFGTFFAADGGQVPKPYGDPYGPVDPYGGIPIDDDTGELGDPVAEANQGGRGELTQPIDIGFGKIGLDFLNPTPLSLGLGLVGLATGIPGLGLAASMIGPPDVNALGQTQAYGFGNQNIDAFGNVVGSPENIASITSFNPNTGTFGIGEKDFSPGLAGVEGLAAQQQAVADFAAAHGEEVGSASEPGEEMGGHEFAQGGVVEAGIGGLLKALSPAALAADTLGIADVDKFKAKDVLGMLSPAAFFGKDPKRLKYLSPAYMASQKPSALSPAATVMMNRGMAQGGGISSLAYGGDPAPVGFANKAFEGMVPGQGTGMSDDVPFSIEGQQPALLSRDEYVLPADVVSQLGDGSSGAGADMLDSFVSNVRQTKYGNTQQPAPVGPQLMTGLMRQGGTV